MKLVITGASGHVGGALARALVAAGEAPRLVSRTPNKLEAMLQAGAQHVAGSHTEAQTLADALPGADLLFWMTPPGYAIADYPTFQRELGARAAEAIRRAGVPRVVNLSSFGAHLPSGTGPIAGLHAIEAQLDEAAPNVTHLRPVVFFENYLAQAAAIRDSGCVYMPVSGATRVPLVATADVGAIAARRARDAHWRGRSVLGVHGPDTLTFDEAAAVLSEGLGRTVKHVAVPPERAREAMVGRGMSASFAGLLVELYGALERGHLVSAEPRTPDNTGATPLLEFARRTLRPLVEAQPR